MNESLNFDFPDCRADREFPGHVPHTSQMSDQRSYDNSSVPRPLTDPRTSLLKL